MVQKDKKMKGEFGSCKFSQTEAAKGYTLVELMVAMVISMIVMAVMYRVYESSSKASVHNAVSIEIQQTLRVGIGYMSREIRMAGLDPRLTGNFGIEVADVSNIRFTLDRNMDGVVNNHSEERMTLRLADGRLQIGLYEGTSSEDFQPLIDNVSELEFCYFDADGEPTDTLEDIAAVDILLEIEEDAARLGTLRRRISTCVFARNLEIKSRVRNYLANND